jgi:hypothetical protein
VVIQRGMVERKRRSRSPEGAATGGQRCDLDGESKVIDLVGPISLYTLLDHLSACRTGSIA